MALMRSSCLYNFMRKPTARYKDEEQTLASVYLGEFGFNVVETKVA